MAFPSGESSDVKNGNDSDKAENNNLGGRWYFSRKEIEDMSPSRGDGIDRKKEAYLRKTYCTFLQDLGMRLKVPQVTIATAIVFCHRFFLHQSHAKNDRRTVATVCMFLAGKVEETPRPLKDVVLVSYEIIHKKDPSAIQKIKQKEVYEQRKELILLGERLVLTTLGFDLNVYHPYKPLVEAIKKFKVAQNALAQVAWNFVNDGLRTSLCLQYKPHLIAAGAIFLAAKFLKVKLPSDGEKVWWQEFDVTPRQLEDVSNQMLELYEQNRGQSSLTNEVEGNIGGINQPATVASAVSESSITANEPSPDAGLSSSRQGPTEASAYADTKHVAQKHNDGSEKGGFDHSVDERKNHSIHDVDKNHDYSRNATETSKGSISNKTANNLMEAKGHDGGQVSYSGEAAEEFTSPDAITKIDKNKVKAALEKRRRLRNNLAKKNDIMDDDDLIERELEDGIELSTEDDSLKQGKYRGFSKLPLLGTAKPRASNSEHDHGHKVGFENAEEGELSSLEEQELPSPKYRNMVANSKHSTEVSGIGRPDGLKRNRDDYESSKPVNERVMVQQNDGYQFHRDASGPGGMGYPEREYKKRHASHG